MDTFNNSWDEVFLSEGFDFTSLLDKLEFYYREYKELINPKKENVFRAFKVTDLKDISVVILGQDPYPGKNVADGLAFSTYEYNKTPASLLNINKELNLEYGFHRKLINDLTYLAKQGVFLFNTYLISLEGKPLFFAKEKIFKDFSRFVITTISNKCDHVVFILFGGKAQSNYKYIDINKHCILNCTHPSPLSANRGFFGSNIFKETNNKLLTYNKEIIKW